LAARGPRHNDAEHHDDGFPGPPPPLWPPLFAFISVGTTEQSAIFIIIIDGHGNGIIIIIIIVGCSTTERMDHTSKSFSNVVSTIAPLVSND
jgi:hypothetical protein